MLDPNIILQHLRNCEPRILSALPDEHGVYALCDHTGKIRYIGVTASIKIGFKNRICSYHVTGSEGRSHKFSHAYNTGRMWRSRQNYPAQDPLDAKIAKDLRTQFCRKYCKAVYYKVPTSSSRSDYFRELTALEAQIHAIAPEKMRDWERLNFNEELEPTDLVDELLEGLRYGQNKLDALQRQANLCQKLIAEKRSFT